MSRYLSLPTLKEAMRYRLGVASRVLAAAVGGYALTTALTTLLLVTLMNAPEIQIRVAALRPGFLIGILILLWVFHARSALRVWLWLAIWTAIASSVCWWLLIGRVA